MNLRVAGNILKQRRTKQGLTLKDVSDKTGFTIGHISLIERGEMKNPSFNAMLAICDALDLSFYRLVADVELIDRELPKKKQKASLSLLTAAT